MLAATSGGDDEEPVAAPNEFAGATMPDGLRAPDFELRDEQGEPVSMRALRGQPVVVTFLYSHCQDTCPITAADDPRRARRPRPRRARARDLRRPAERHAGQRPQVPRRAARDGRIRFVLGSRAQLRPIWKGYGVTPQRITQEHLARITLVDERGFQRVGFPIAEATPERLAHDLRLLEAAELRADFLLLT